MMVCSDEKRRRIMAATIPDDLLLAEVLIRLSAKSLARCRCVCRSWRAGIADVAFVSRHRELSRARPPPSVLAIPREIDPDDRHAITTEISFHRVLAPPPGHLATEADLVFEKAWPDGITRIIEPTHCDGLVAIATATDRVFVCNPATQVFVALPLGNHNAEVDGGNAKAVPVALGFDQWRNSYVVARHFYRTYGEMTYDETTGGWSPEYNMGHELFTLGGGSWELTEDPARAIDYQSPISTRRGFYWHSGRLHEPRLMRFGLRDRKFEVVSRPPTCGWSLIDGMANLDGKLCYVHAAADESFHVWMADDGGPGPDLQWPLLCRVDLHDPILNLTYNFMPVGMEHRLQYTRSDGSKYKCRPHDSMDCIMPYFETLISPATCNYWRG